MDRARFKSGASGQQTSQQELSSANYPRARFKAQNIQQKRAAIERLQQYQQYKEATRPRTSEEEAALIAQAQKQAIEQNKAQIEPYIERSKARIEAYQEQIKSYAGISGGQASIDQINDKLQREYVTLASLQESYVQGITPGQAQDIVSNVRQHEQEIQQQQQEQVEPELQMTTSITTIKDKPVGGQGMIVRGDIPQAPRIYAPDTSIQMKTREGMNIQSVSAPLIGGNQGGYEQLSENVAKAVYPSLYIKIKTEQQNKEFIKMFQANPENYPTTNITNATTGEILFTLKDDFYEQQLKNFTLSAKKEYAETTPPSVKLLGNIGEVGVKTIQVVESVSKGFANFGKNIIPSMSGTLFSGTLLTPAKTITLESGERALVPASLNKKGEALTVEGLTLEEAPKMANKQTTTPFMERTDIKNIVFPDVPTATVAGKATGIGLTVGAIVVGGYSGLKSVKLLKATGLTTTEAIGQVAISSAESIAPAKFKYGLTDAEQIAQAQAYFAKDLTNPRGFRVTVGDKTISLYGKQVKTPLGGKLESFNVEQAKLKSNKQNEFFVGGTSEQVMTVPTISGRTYTLKTRDIIGGEGVILPEYRSLTTSIGRTERLGQLDTQQLRENLKANVFPRGLTPVKEQFGGTTVKAKNELGEWVLSKSGKLGGLNVKQTVEGELTGEFGTVKGINEPFLKNIKFNEPKLVKGKISEGNTLGYAIPELNKIKIDVKKNVKLKELVRGTYYHERAHIAVHRGASSNLGGGQKAYNKEYLKPYLKEISNPRTIKYYKSLGYTKEQIPEEILVRVFEEMKTSGLTPKKYLNILAKEQPASAKFAEKIFSVKSFKEIPSKEYVSALLSGKTKLKRPYEFNVRQKVGYTTGDGFDVTKRASLKFKKEPTVALIIERINPSIKSVELGGVKSNNLKDISELSKSISQQPSQGVSQKQQQNIAKLERTPVTGLSSVSSIQVPRQTQGVATSLTPLTNQKVATAQQQKVSTMQQTKLATQQVNKTATITSTINRTATSTIQRTMTTPASAQIQRTITVPQSIFAPSSSTPPRPIQPVPKVPVGFPFPVWLRSKSQSISSGKGFGVQVRRQGVFKNIGRTATFGKALALGSQKVGKTLAATFRVSGQGAMGSVFKMPKTIKQVKGKRLTFMEIPSARLDSPGELREINMFKMKGGRK